MVATPGSTATELPDIGDVALDTPIEDAEAAKRMLMNMDSCPVRAYSPSICQLISVSMRLKVTITQTKVLICT